MSLYFPLPDVLYLLNLGSECVVRSMYSQYQVYKFPLNISADEHGHGYNPVFSPYGGSVIPSDIQLLSARLSLAGAIGMAANGVPIYPSFDNADYVVWEVSESSNRSVSSLKIKLSFFLWVTSS